jgi:hypothetical protein
MVTKDGEHIAAGAVAGPQGRRDETLLRGSDLVTIPLNILADVWIVDYSTMSSEDQENELLKQRFNQNLFQPSYDLSVTHDMTDEEYIQKLQPCLRILPTWIHDDLVELFLKMKFEFTRNNNYNYYKGPKDFVQSNLFKNELIKFTPHRIINNIRKHVHNVPTVYCDDHDDHNVEKKEEK